MTLSMYDASAPVFRRMLHNAGSWLDKAAAHAEAKNFDTRVLVEGRLAPDMMPLRSQVQIATDYAKFAVARLGGLEPPRWADDESTFPELKGRIDKCLAFLDTVPREALDGSEEREIVLPSPRGERRYLGQAYLTDYVLPNFYFHLTTAYALLRHNGVELGKKDFLVGSG